MATAEKVLDIARQELGNTESPAGSQSNGGQVCRKPRPYSQIVGAFCTRAQAAVMTLRATKE